MRICDWSSDVCSSDLLSREGDASFDDAARMQSNLDQFRQELETAGLAFSYRLVSVLLIMGAIAVTILVVGLRYLSRDYTSKIGEIAAGMRQLAEGDHDFSIEGQHREDELGDMVRALQQFQRANVRLQQWARERGRSEEHTSELQPLLRISYAVFCLKQ